MRHPTSTLEGPLLDAAVAIAEGLPFSRIQDGVVWLHLTELRSGSVRECPDFSTCWDDGGPIIERERIATEPTYAPGEAAVPNGGWFATLHAAQMAFGEGATPLIAAMRAYVASKLGDEVELPA